MLWSRERQFFHWPFEKEAELEAAILESQRDLFGDTIDLLPPAQLLTPKQSDM